MNCVSAMAILASFDYNFQRITQPIQFRPVTLQESSIFRLLYLTHKPEGGPMTIQLNLPEDIASAFGSRQDLSRAALESLALVGYRSGCLSEEQLRRMLGFESRFQLHEFLKRHHTYLNYTEDDLDDVLKTARHFPSQRPSFP